MTKLIVFWLLGILTLAIVGGGGAALFFWIYGKAKKSKIL